MASSFSKCGCIRVRGTNQCLVASAWVTLGLSTIVMFAVIIIQILVVMKMLPFVIHSLILFFSTLFNYFMTVFITLLFLSKIQSEDRSFESRDDSLEPENVESSQRATDEFVLHSPVSHNNLNSTSSYNSPPPYETTNRNVQTGRVLSNRQWYRRDDSSVGSLQEKRLNILKKQESSQSSNHSESHQILNGSPKQIAAPQCSSFQSRNITTLDVRSKDLPKEVRTKYGSNRDLDKNNTSSFERLSPNKTNFLQCTSPSRNVDQRLSTDQRMNKDSGEDLDNNNPSDFTSILDQQIEELKNFSDNLKQMKENIYANLPAVLVDVHKSEDQNTGKIASYNNLEVQNSSSRAVIKTTPDDYGKLKSLYKADETSYPVLDNTYEHKGIDTYEHKGTSLSNLDKLENFGVSNIADRKAVLPRMSAISEETLAKPAARAKPFVRNQKSSDDVQLYGKSFPNLVNNTTQIRRPNYFELVAHEACEEENDEPLVEEAKFEANTEVKKINEMLSLYNRKMRQNIRNLKNNEERSSAQSVAPTHPRVLTTDIASNIIRF